MPARKTPVGAGRAVDVVPGVRRHPGHFASTALTGGIPITDVPQWRGRRSIEVTYRIYRHLKQSTWDQARTVVDHAYLEAMADGPSWPRARRRRTAI